MTLRTRSAEAPTRPIWAFRIRGAFWSIALGFLGKSLFVCSRHPLLVKAIWLLSHLLEYLLGRFPCPGQA